MFLHSHTLSSKLARSSNAEQPCKLPPFLLSRRSSCGSSSLKGRVTAPGPDGWNKTLLKKLTQPMLEDVAQLYNALEKGVKVPQQFTVTQVCMLPKSPTAERPISLTHVLWRDYCRVRWPLLRVWLERYQLCAPWDSAVPGRTCLDVGIRRLLWAEAFSHTVQALHWDVS